MRKESFFDASDVVPILYNNPCIYELELNIFGRDYSNLKDLKKVQWECKLDHLKIVTNLHQYAKTT